ncbi:MAG TPA: NAD(P)/FAD-dependent oxidoreductase [Ktedonobacteraceae bacterium]|nr:NAD(P)/FAD-dependent oxidoreductase [Ktedonobacteraceae bacterium]
MSQVFTGKDERFSSENGQYATLPSTSSHDESPVPHVHIAILGTGFSGLGMAIRLKQQGEEDFVVLEKSMDIGGTWRDNTYPGCACDIPSHLYSFSFALNPYWSRAYSSQREIWNYLRRCAKRFGILPHIQWNSELQQAGWNESDQCWHITTSQGQLTADILILGNGPLSEPSLPSIPGIEGFEGVLFHSAQWRHDYDLTGKRVAVIGTGASAVQFVPHIQPQVDHLSLFLRTPPWILPRLDHQIPSWQRALYRILPITQRLVRGRIYLRNELIALALVHRPAMLEDPMRIARRYLEKQIADPALRAKLTPQYVMGCKRILLSDDFYPALTKPNVEVVSDRIREVRVHSIVTEDGNVYEVDVIICGTGFHVTDTSFAHAIHGRGGQSLAERWQAGPQAYLGTTVSGFPNLFLLIGPNTGLGHNSMVYMVESQLSYILDALRLMDKRHLRAMEVKAEDQEAFNAEMQRRLIGTVWLSGCASWYLDAHGRNTTIWPGFTFEFRHRTRRFDARHYEMIPQRASAPAGQATAHGLP